MFLFSYMPRRIFPRRSRRAQRLKNNATPQTDGTGESRDLKAVRQEAEKLRARSRGTRRKLFGSPNNVRRCGSCGGKMRRR